MSEVWRAPNPVGVDWLLRAGRSLMAWWNGQGPDLPPEGERYRAWWHATDAELRGAWGGPGVAAGDAHVQALVNASVAARDWWARSGRVGAAPPEIVPQEPLAPSSGRALALLGTVAVIAVAVAVARR